MSTYWDIHCRDCDDGCGFHVNHGEQRLAGLLREIGEWACVPDNDDVEMSLMGDEHRGMASWPDFAREHFAHDVTLRSEYGDYFDECCESIACPTCGGSTRCRRAMRHTGKHSAERDHDGKA